MKRRDFLKLSASLVTTAAAPIFIGRTRETDLGYLQPGQVLTVQYNLLDDADGEILVKCFLDIEVEEILPDKVKLKMKRHFEQFVEVIRAE